MSDHKTEAEIRTLAEGTAAKLFDKSGEHTTCSRDNAEYIIESALRSLTPPQEPVMDREALGNALYKLILANRDAISPTLDASIPFDMCGPIFRKSICSIATQFALSIQKKEGVCEGTVEYKIEWCRNSVTLIERSSLQSKPSDREMAQYAAKYPDLKCRLVKITRNLEPFCSNKIQEQGGGKV